MRLSLHYPVSPACIRSVCTIVFHVANRPRPEGTSWDLLHAYEYLLESLESAKKIAVSLPDSEYLTVNINLGWMKLDEYYQHLILGEQVLVFDLPQFLDNCLGFGNPCSSLAIIAPQIIE